MMQPIMPALVQHSLLCLFALLAPAFAQELRIDAPAERLVGPGEFVTLVFRLDSAEDLTVSGEVVSELGWRILRQPGPLSLPAGRSVPVAITVGVPADAAAGVRDRIDLELRGGGVVAAAQALLTVAEIVDFDLLVPDSVLLDEGGFDAQVVNRGNVAAELRLEVRRDGERLLEIPLTLAPGETRTENIPLDEEGFVELHLLGGARPLVRSVRVLRFGIPDPPPLLLEAEASAELDSSGRFRVALSLAGALSDFVAVAARLDSDLEGSFITIGDSSSRELVHLGADPPQPFRLPLPNDPGVVVLSQGTPWSTALAAGTDDTRGASGYLALRYGDERNDVAAAGGYLEPDLFGTVRGRLELPQAGSFAVRLDGAATYRGDRLDTRAEVSGTRARDRAVAGLELALRDAFADSGLFEVRARASDRISTLQAAATIPLGTAGRGSWRVGGEIELPTGLPGSVHALLQLGEPSSHAQLRYRVDFGSGWRSDNSAGVLGDSDGFGVRLATNWSYGSGPDNNAGIGADLVFRPDSERIEGRIDTRLQTEIDILALLASAGWDLSGGSVGAGISARLLGSDWQLRLDLDADYSYELPAEPFRFEATLQGSYALEFSPHPALVELAGGRNLGRIEGRIATGATPVEGVEISVGRFRVRTDADGRFSAELEPGIYRVRLEVATLPIDVRPFGPAELDIEVSAQQTSEVAFDTRRTASLRGRVLADSDGDGVPDDPPVGVRARLLLREANGVTRSLVSDADGAFSARGIAPGAAELRLVEQPFGNSAIGPTTLLFEAEPGGRLEALFLSRPAQSTAQTFGGGLRISRIEIVPDRAPPGSAPLLRISVRGDADRVFIDGPAGESELAQLGEVWIGRYPLPADAGDGTVSVRVVARQGDIESERQARLVIDADAPLLEATARGPVEPGGTLAIEAEVHLGAAAVRADFELGPGAELTEAESGRWTGGLDIPDEAEDGIYLVTVQAITDDGRSFEATVRFRVLVPDAP